MGNRLPLRDIVGLLLSVEDGDLLGTVPLHPVLDDVVMEPIKADSFGWRAVFENEGLDLLLQTVHLRLHVFRLQQRKTEVLAQTVRQLDLVCTASRPHVGAESELPLDLGVQAL